MLTVQAENDGEVAHLGSTARHSRWEAIGPGLVAAGVVVIALLPLLRLWKLDLQIPYNYSQADANAHQLLIKTTIEYGWYEHNPAVGAPGGLTLHAFPMPDNFHLAVARVMGLAVQDSGVVYNLYYLAGYPLAALTAAWMMRRLGVARLAAVGMGVLYALLPYHFGRGGNGHIFLAAYFAVPLIAERLVTLAAGRPVVSRRPGSGLKGLVTATTSFTVVACVLTASVSGYYAAFAAVLAAGAGVLGAIAGPRRRAVAGASIIVILLMLTQLAHLAPDLLYRAAHPETAAIGHRQPGETEHLALKLTQLVLPISGHRLEPLHDLRNEYDSAFPLPSEGNQIPLGLIGSAGFLGLLGLMFAGAVGRPARTATVRALSGLTGFSFLVATVGGLSSLVALLGPTQVRGWNRMVVYLGFFSLTAVGLALSRLQAWRDRPKLVLPAVVAAVVVIGMLDQTTDRFVPDYLHARTEYQNDRAFVGRIEAAMPEEAAILQLPYVRYPEEPPVERMIDYDHLRGYLHSESLRWSYGSIKGTDDWKRRLSTLDAKFLPLAASAAGFSGIWIDRFGYSDSASGIERVLQESLGAPITSRNARFAFYDVRQAADGVVPDVLRRVGAVVVDPVTLLSTPEVHSEESDESGPFRWIGDRAHLTFENPGPEPRVVELSFRLVPGVAGDWAASVSWPDGMLQDVTVSEDGVSLERSLRLPVGTTEVVVHTDAPRVPAPADPRELRLRVEDLRIDELSPLLTGSGT